MMTDTNGRFAVNRLFAAARIRSFLLAFVLLASLGAAFARDDSPRELSLKDRREIFEEVWETIHEKYYDPKFNGVDWFKVREDYRPIVETAKTDDEFYLLMKRMVAELRDAHTRFHTPRERRERERSFSIGVGIALSEVEGQIVVTRVEADSEASLAGVKAGMILRSVDGRPVAEKMTEMSSRLGESSSERATRLRLHRELLEGEAGAPVSLGLIAPDGKPFDVTLARQVVSTAPKVMAIRLASDIAYLKFNVWKSHVHSEIKRALQQMRSAHGLILDLRGNPGGEAHEVLEVADYFFNQRVSFGSFFSREGKTIELRTSRKKRVYSGPVAILIDEASGSGSELFAAAMQEQSRAVVVGRASCGCVLGIARFKRLEGGSELAVSELGYRTSAGRRLEGAGVAPDVTVALRLIDLQSGRDVALEQAEKILRSR
ncbi:MAG: S41 family peptidase [Acidobacteriota bacterium]